MVTVAHIQFKNAMGFCLLKTAVNSAKDKVKDIANARARNIIRLGTEL